MTGQHAVDDCDPMWSDWDELCARGAEQLHAPAERLPRDLRRQGLADSEKHRITKVKIKGEWL